MPDRALSEEWQSILVNGLLCSARNELALMRDDASAPHVLMRPSVTRDGDQWCALYGPDLQEGVCGFGPTPAAACDAFDREWRRGDEATASEASR